MHFIWLKNINVGTFFVINVGMYIYLRSHKSINTPNLGDIHSLYQLLQWQVYHNSLKL